MEWIELPIQIVTDYQILKYFMDNKELPKKQIRYFEILSEYNFQVIFRPGKKNEKTDVITKTANNRFFDEIDDRIQHQRQTIFTSDKIDVRFGEMEDGLFEKKFKPIKRTKLLKNTVK